MIATIAQLPEILSRISFDTWKQLYEEEVSMASLSSVFKDLALEEKFDTTTKETKETKELMDSKKEGTLFDTLFEDGELRSYIEDNTVDPWIGTYFADYTSMSPKQKGEFGERFVSKLAEKEGFIVETAHSSTAGYDRIINGKKVEIKFSLATRTKKKAKTTGYMSLKATELRNILRERNLRVSGNKPELVLRLEDWDESHPEEDRHPCLIEDVTDDFGVKTDSFVINHVSKEKDWEYLVFCGINPEESDMRLIWFSNEDFKKHVETSCFNTQQGGKKIANDDYMCTDFDTLRNYDWVHEDFSTFTI